MNECELSDDLLERALAEHNLVIASEFAVGDNEPATEADLRQRFRRERVAQRRGLRIPSRQLRQKAETHSPEATSAVQAQIFPTLPNNGLTPLHATAALPENVRNFLDWLIDEELKRWREEQ